VANPPHTIKLNQNESSVELPADLKRKIVRELERRPWARYPDYPPVRLTAAIARRLRIARKRVLVGHGSNELLYALAQATLERGTAVVLPSPSYAVARLAATLAGGRIATFPLDRKFQYDPETVVKAVRRHEPRLVFLPSPNNPTGGSLHAGPVAAVAEASRSLVVVDEAYHEFSRIDLLPLLRRHTNLVLLRTLSKACRLAAFRIGYLLGDPAVLHRVERGKPPHSIDLPSQIAGEILFGEETLLRDEIERVIDGRDRLAEALGLLSGVTVFPSDANFLLLRVPNAESTYLYLLRRGILVRRLAGAGGRLKNCLRVTIGTSFENRAVLQALTERFGRRPA
jgi:histidinol-phosphate aminotransferase